MAIDPVFDSVNGQRVSHASLELGLEGERIVGVKSVSYKNSIEKPKIWGTSRSPIGRTGGKEDPEGEVEFYAEEFWTRLLPRITRNGLVGYTELAWTLKLRYTEKLGVTTGVQLIGTCFLGPDVSHSEGADHITCKVPLSIMSLVVSGKYQAFSIKAR
jgi:hypothetical protein